jgi:hypothetical protein
VVAFLRGELVLVPLETIVALPLVAIIRSAVTRLAGGLAWKVKFIVPICVATRDQRKTRVKRIAKAPFPDKKTTVLQVKMVRPENHEDSTSYTKCDLMLPLATSVSRSSHYPIEIYSR